LRLAEITRNIQLNPLHEPTITTLKKLNATPSDLQNGFLQASCNPTPGNNPNNIDLGNPAPTQNFDENNNPVNNNVSF
jgi:hypothetical protein